MEPDIADMMKLKRLQHRLPADAAGRAELVAALKERNLIGATFGGRRHGVTAQMDC